MRRSAGHAAGHPAGRGLLAGRALMALTAAFAVALTGFGWYFVHGAVRGITVSQALAGDAPRSGGGAMNILLMGLDSRKDQDGNALPSDILDQLHAGDSDQGGYNTNTLILIHVSADDRVVAFSIPRDDYVAVHTIPGYDHIKIKEAYGLTKASTEQRLVDEGVTDQQELETRGREAGRAATLSAVRALTGAPIDYFAEINLAGFYDLAASLGGVEVCLNNAVHDDYSGADFPAGRQRLDAAQTLAFVRQRHGLDNGDLDRTHRQQAFLISVMHQLRDAGTFTDLTKLNSLIAIARKDIVLSAGWGEEQFRRIGALAGSDVEYRTLPVLRYDTVNGQDVNIVAPEQIRMEVAAAFDGKTVPTTTAAPDPAMVVDVVNAGGAAGLAAEVSAVAQQHGFGTGEVRDATPGEPVTTGIDYGVAASADAQLLATTLGIDAAPRPDPALGADRIRVTVSADYTAPTEDAAPQYVSSDLTMPTPDQGPPISAGTDIPCVN